MIETTVEQWRAAIGQRVLVRLTDLPAIPGGASVAEAIVGEVAPSGRWVRLEWEQSQQMRSSWNAVADYEVVEVLGWAPAPWPHVRLETPVRMMPPDGH